MKFAIALALLLSSSFGCKPRVEGASAVRADEAALGDFDSLIARIDDTSGALTINMVVGNVADLSTIEGFALQGDEGLSGEIKGLIDRAAIVAKKDNLTPSDRSLLQSLSLDLEALLQLAPDLSEAQVQTAKAMLVKVAERLATPDAPKLLQLAMSPTMACLNADGKLTCWGGDEKFGMPAADVAPPKNLGKVSKVVVGARTACAIADGKSRCWGEAASSRQAMTLDGMLVQDISLASNVGAGDDKPETSTYCVAVAKDADEVTCVAPPDRGVSTIFAVTKPRLVAVVDYGFMACVWSEATPELECWGKHGTLDRRELSFAFPYPGKPTEMAFTTEGFNIALCLNGPAGVRCIRDKPGAERRGNKVNVNFPKATDFSHYNLCTLESGRIQCTEPPFDGVDFSGLKDVAAFDMFYTTNGSHVVCAAFKNGKVQCLSKDSDSKIMAVPAAIKAP